METTKTYDDYPAWLDFQAYYPEEFRITPNSKPNEEYWDWDEYSVHLDRYIPKNNNKKVKILLVHGGGGNGRLMAPMGVVLSGLGYECVAPDMPGFGLTKIKKPNSYNTWVELVSALVDKEMEKDGKPIVLCGISLGGMLAYHAACVNKKIKGIMVSSLADTTDPVVQIQLSKNDLIGKTGAKTLSAMKKLTDNIKVPIKLTTKMWAMANDPSFVKKLKKDKVGSGSWVYLKFLRTLFEATPTIDPENFNNCPLFFFQPEKDFIIPWEISEPFYNRLSCEKEMIFLENCGHIPMETPGLFQLKDKALAFIEKVENNL